MQRLSIMDFIGRITFVCLTMVSVCAFGADLAGSVSFVVGDVSAADGSKTRAIVRGDSVYAGETLVTGANGHIHLKMADGAFVSVRPQSRFRIEEYHYDPAVPANNRIKFLLEQGVARSITGRAGEAARENYRLNTPLAAIGIRGTDFVVQATHDITRVTVQSGAVVMSPLSGDCIASAFGPCKSASARVLTAAMQNAYLELRNRNEAPLLVPAEKALESPNLVAPPRPEEPHASGDNKQGKTGATTNSALSDVTAGNIKNKVDAAAAAALPPAPVKYWWGRYSNYVTPGAPGSIGAVMAPDREISVGNEVFGLLRESSDVASLPSTGVAKFQLVDSEAYFMKDFKTLAPGQVSGASLTVDFNTRRYDTALTVNGNGYAPVAVHSSGQVTGQAEFKADANASGTTVLGSLSRYGDQAGYLFQRNLSGGLSVVGATRWTH
jgi:hypothetical protein